MRKITSTLLGLALSSCAAPDASACFAPGTELPELSRVVRAPGVGDSAITLATALVGGDVATARRLIGDDPELARLKLGEGSDMLSLAVSGCSVENVELLLRAGAPADGQGSGLPLTLALRAKDDAMARALLQGGASPNPAGAPTVPMRTAIGLNLPDRVAMLIEAGADVERAERTGRRPLHIALDQERFRIAAQLLDAGADPWAIDAGGANLGTAVATPMLTKDAVEEKAQRDLRERLVHLGWPQPAPDPRTVRAWALEGRWPPPGAKGGKPVPEPVLEMIRERAR